MVAKKGPPSALEGGVGSPGKTVNSEPAKGQSYSVQKHSAEDGLEVVYVTATSGDEAAQKVLAAAKYKSTSIRGVTPASDPDGNSLGGEREAAIMFANAENGGTIINTLGTEANAKAVEGLGKADVKELGN